MTPPRPPPSAPPPAGEVHLYAGRLDAGAEVVARLRGTLSPEERTLAERRVTAALRRRAILSRGLLRIALGGALGKSPAEVALAVGPHGKPELADPAAAARVAFNLTHTGEAWLLALAPRGPIGVDMEAPRDETDWDALVDRYFSAAEGVVFRALPPDRRQEAFFRTWATKEAFLKARGSGLTTPLRDFDVVVDPDQPVGLEAVRIAAESPSAWWVREVPGMGAPTVVVGRGPAPRLRTMELSPDLD